MFFFNDAVGVYDCTKWVVGGTSMKRWGRIIRRESRDVLRKKFCRPSATVYTADLTCTGLGLNRRGRECILLLLIAWRRVTVVL